MAKTPVAWPDVILPRFTRKPGLALNHVCVKSSLGAISSGRLRRTAFLKTSDTISASARAWMDSNPLSRAYPSWRARAREIKRYRKQALSNPGIARAKRLVEIIEARCLSEVRCIVGINRHECAGCGNGNERRFPVVPVRQLQGEFPDLLLVLNNLPG